MFEDILHPALSDFVQYWAAWNIVKSGGNPYDIPTMLSMQNSLGRLGDYPLMMYNPPWLLTLLSPILSFDFSYSVAIFLAFNVLLIILQAKILSSAYLEKLDQKKLPIVLLLMLTFPPLLVALYLGQVSIILSLACIAVYWGLTKHHYPITGVSLSILTIKPQLFFLLFLLILWWSVQNKNYKILIVASLFLAGLLCFLLLQSTTLLFQWVDFVRSETLMKYASGTFPGFLSFVIFPGSHSLGLLYGITFLPSLLVSVGFLLYCIIKQPSINWETMYPSILCISIFTAPYGWFFDFTALILVYVLLIFDLIGGKRRARLIFGISLLVSIMCVVLIILGVRDYHYYFIVPLLYFLIFQYRNWEARKGLADSYQRYRSNGLIKRYEQYLIF
ncbi:MAG: DUF2029 domain-containing protein [Deltaproteobacteria bacterium]|nr:DUF2029 domain-containing protein [Deltaproteobacteria bacterium]